MKEIGNATYHLEIKTIDEPRDEDKQRPLREPVPNANSPPCTKLPRTAQNVIFIPIEPPLWHISTRIFVILWILRNACVVDNEVRAFGEIVAFELQVLS